MTLLMAILSAAFTARAAMAGDAYYRVRLGDLQFTDGTLPGDISFTDWRHWQRLEAFEPYAVLDNGGTAFVVGSITAAPWMPRPSRSDQAMEIRIAADQEVTGRLFVPKSDFSGMVALTFKAPANMLKSSTRNKFLEGEEAHYRRLRERNLPGAAWFRHEEEAAAAARGTKPSATPPTAGFWGRQPDRGLDGTFELFSGGRAVSENLQLDRAMLATPRDKLTEALTNLTGLTVKAMDWKSISTNAAKATDPLAANIPFDQHAIFFPSFQGMTEMLDEADGNGTPLLQWYEARSENADCRDRYQQQLCLGLNEISRRLGPKVIRSAAFTGSDPYLRTGSDVGVLFETSNPDALKAFMLARQTAAMQGAPEVKGVQGETNGVAYVGVVSPDRTVCSYVASTGNVVFVCNSLYQLGRLVDTANGKTPALLSQEDYLYFRNRYPLESGDESAFLVLPDAAIRRWCGPRWRIANSRRTRAAALLADIQAAHLEQLVKGETSPAPETNNDFPDAGLITFTSHGVLSSVYGNLAFLTPISEMNLDYVTKAEADAYNRWLDSYQQNWRQFFDPIAARFSLRPERVGVEMTVMPLISRTEYHEIADIAMGAGIAPAAGDPHDGTLAHLALSVNTQSTSFKQAGGFIGSMSPAIKANPLGWMGQSLALYADESPFWDKFKQATNKDEFLDKNYKDLPVALHCEVKDPLGLTVFLTSLHAFADQSAPGMAVWENHDYNGQPYVKVAPRPNPNQANPEDNLTIYYAATPAALMVTLDETVLKHALDREAARAAAKKDGKPLPTAGSPWLGANLCLKIDRRFLDALSEIIDVGNASQLQSVSWNNLPILNEWKRRFPNEDPVKLQERFWQTKLVCPGGGTYVWNEKWQTMESTVFGCPAAPKDGPKLSLMPDMKDANLGLEFVNQGLSAKAIVNRLPKNQ